MDTSIREVTTSATLQEKKKLRKEFRLFDMIFYTVAAIIGIDTLGAVSSNPQALTWLVISAITFLIPYGLLTAEIGSTFTQEGGVYEWCKLAGGRIFASFAAMLYWISNPLWVGGTLSVTAIIALKTFWFGGVTYLGGSKVSDAIIEIAIALVFIWGTTWCAIMSLRFGKWLSVFGSYVKLALFIVLIVLTIVFVTGGHATGTHFGTADLLPNGNVLIIFTAILPVLIFNWVGFELQNGAGEEMHNPQRDVPRSLIRAGIVAAIAYAIPITVIFFALSKSQISSSGGFVLAFQVVTGVLPSGVATALGWIVAIGIVIALASSGGTWIIGADRTYAIASLDRTAPSFLGRFSGKYGTPIVVNTMSGIVATITMVVAVLISEFAAKGSNVQVLFGFVLGFVISTTTISYLFIFPAYFILRLKYPNVHRPYKVPGGLVGAGIVTILPLAYAAIATYFILWPLDSALSVDRLTYELTQFIPLGIIALLTLVFYVWGHLEKGNRDVVVDLNLETQSEAVAGGGE